jgi:hypothetical protein
MLTVGVLHLAALWSLLQPGLAAQATRQMVYQVFSPITRQREQPQPVPQPMRAVERKVPPVPVQPVIERAAEPIVAPLIQKLEAVTPARTSIQQQDIKASVDMRRALDLTRIEPVLAPVPVIPTPPLPEPLPTPPPVVAFPTALEPAPPPVQTPPAAAAPEPLVPAPVPIAAPARAAAITPVEPRSSSGTAGAANAASSTTSGLLLPTPGALPRGAALNYNYKPEARGRQKSASELANEQLNPGGRKDKFSTAVEATERPDCINSGQALGILAPAMVAYNVLRDKCK